MKTTNKMTRAVHFLKKVMTKKSPMKIKVDDLINSRFGINDLDEKNSSKDSNSLQFLMYSKENDILFI